MKNATHLEPKHMSAKAIPVLMYHHVSPNQGLVTVSPDIFNKQMQLIHNAGYHTVTAQDFSKWLIGEKNLPSKSILITFDDGYLDNYVYAYPILRQYGLHGIIFVVTGWISDRETRPCNGEKNIPSTPNHSDCKKLIAQGRSDEVMLRWAEIERMIASGTIEIHSHTHSHIRWDQQYSNPIAKHEALYEDLFQSQRTLKKHLGFRDHHLCWPWGYFETSYSKIANDLGFTIHYTVQRGTNTIETDPFQIHRIDTKPKANSWITRQLYIYRSEWRSNLYLKLRNTDLNCLSYLKK